MDIQEILSQLEQNEGDFPKAALQEAIAHREDMIPPLLDVLETVASDPIPFIADEDRMIHLYAMYLLAQFRETRAYPLLVQIFSIPGEVAFELAGDAVTDALGRILASVSDDDISGITSLIENEHANEYVRSAAMDGLLVLVACGRRTRNEVMAYLRGLFHTLERTPGIMWGALAAACADLCPAEVEMEVRQAYEGGLVDPGFVSWTEIRKALAEGPEIALERAKTGYTMINDVVEEMEWWACFHEDQETFEAEDSFDPMPGTLEAWEPKRQTEPKVGRNEPCPCGSGKKFKKCCGR